MAKAISMSSSDSKYEAKDAARTLMKAEEIRGNPKLHKRAQNELSRQLKATKRAIGKKK